MQCTREERVRKEGLGGTVPLPIDVPSMGAHALMQGQGATGGRTAKAEATAISGRRRALL